MDALAARAQKCGAQLRFCCPENDRGKDGTVAAEKPQAHMSAAYDIGIGQTHIARGEHRLRVARAKGARAVDLARECRCGARWSQKPVEPKIMTRGRGFDSLAKTDSQPILKRAQALRIERKSGRHGMTAAGRKDAFVARRTNQSTDVDPWQGSRRAPTDFPFKSNNKGRLAKAIL